MAGFGRIRFDDLQAAGRYRPRAAYGQSKLAAMLMGMHLAQLADRAGLSLLSTLAHTGFTRAEPRSGSDDARPRRRSKRPPTTDRRLPPMHVSQGVDATLFAACDPAPEQGVYYGPSEFAGLAGPTKRRPLPRSARRDPALACQLWSLAERLTGTT